MSHTDINQVTDTQKQNPSRYQVAGEWIERQDKYHWDGLDSDGSDTAQDGCCGGAQEIWVADMDAYDTEAAIYVSSDKRDNCCGGRWTHAEHLTTLVPLPPIMDDLAKFATAIDEGALPYRDIKTQVSGLLNQFRREFAARGAAPQGMCSAHMQDVQFVSGTWSHADGMPCSTPAIMLTN